jgi:peptidoglycan hydrolase-like protein with peptidoglycan-binding domain
MTRTPMSQTIGRLAGAALIAGGLAFSLACSAFDAAVSCSIANVQVNGTPTEHKYAFDFNCTSGHQGKVNGSYDTNTKVTQEKAKNADGVLTAEWKCPSDPWIAGGVVCQRLTVQGNYKNAVQNPPDPPSGTYTSYKLSAADQAYLRSRVDLLKAPAPPPPPAPAPAPAPAPSVTWPVLRQGAQGETVTSLQYLLRQHGQDIVVDGDFGPQTVQAVRAFQQTHGLMVDGIAGPKTFEALIVTRRQGDQGEAVSAIQSQLAARGMDVVVDGDYGPQTFEAVKTYQRKNHLLVDGIVGPQTWNALINGR